jgi:transcriptional regulator with XRE-family HTH domain
MEELPLHSNKRFRGALGDALRDRRGNDMGDYNKSEFAREVASKGPWSENTIMCYLKGSRRPTPAALEAMAEVLDLPAGAAYFWEYRLHQMIEVCERHPEVGELIYDAVLKTGAQLDEKAKKSDVGFEGLGIGPGRGTPNSSAK